jgi:hypothetical protein
LTRTVHRVFMAIEMEAMDMVKSAKKKRGRGRPPRDDDPTPIRVLLPGELRQWLRVRAAVEARDQGDVIADALVAYRKRKEGKP